MATRALILSADVGEGHLAAARALGQELRRTEDTTVIERDGLAQLGGFGRWLIRDGYRFQLRFMPWSFGAMYWLGRHCRAARRLGAVVLSLLGRRRILRLVRCEHPDIIVSTHPALTCVLGRMRLRRMLSVPVCATVTDLADYAFWSHPGADLHLVPHPVALAGVERVAGSGSAALVRSLVARGFQVPLEARAARAALDLPEDGGIVAVSGGGWAVGDLTGGAQAALDAGARMVVMLAGRDDQLKLALEHRFAGEPRAQVWGFTDRMPELMRAADALVHSTGGMTSLEALACGCPMVAYGSWLGHMGVHNRSLGALGLISLAKTRSQLSRALRPLLEEAAARAPISTAGADAAQLVARLRPRVRPLSTRRLAWERVVSLLASAALTLATLGTDDAYSVARLPMRVAPLTHVSIDRREVGVVVRVPAGSEAALAARLAAGGMRASFASVAPPSPAATALLRSVHEDWMPELRAPGLVRWLQTRSKLGPGHGSPCRYLAPSGLGLGQYLLARSAGCRPVAGRARVSSSRIAATPPLRAGDIVVVTADGSAGDVAAGLTSLRRRLAARDLRPVSLAQLTAGSSTSAPTAGDDSSANAPATTTASPQATPAVPSGA